MKVFESFSPALQRNLLILFAAGLLFWSGLAALLPTLPLYVESVGANEQTIGIVMGAFALGLLPSRGILARLTDNRGRKLVLLIGIAAVAIAPLGYAITTSIPLLMAIRAFHGISIAAFALAYNALVVDLSPPHQRGEVIGYMSLVNPVGMALGPAIGGFSQEWFGYTPMFLIASGLGFAGLACTLQVSEPNRHVLETQDSEPRFWRMLGDRRIRVPAAILLMVGLSFGALSTFVPLFVREAGVDLNVGLFYTAAAIASFAIRLIVGPLSDRHGRGVFISISLLLYGLAMAMLWQATSASAFLLAGAIEGMGAGILIPMMAALMADRSLPSERGKTFGICMIGFDLGIAVAGPVLGAVAGSTGYRSLFGISAALCLVGFLIFLTASSKSLPASLRFALGQEKDWYAVDPTLETSRST
ncbi:MFS transporter [Phormidium tenue FACHB-886]|nr:MFS transporter [Phormidium tenue FACHB-886]